MILWGKKRLQKMAHDWCKALSEEEKIKNESMLKIGIGICLKQIKNKRRWKTIQKKYVWKRQTKRKECIK